MKSFGKVDSAWDMDRFGDVLGDASEMSEEHDAPFSIGGDRDENLAVVPKAERDKIHYLPAAYRPA